jgi:hypothetical protein
MPIRKLSACLLLLSLAACEGVFDLQGPAGISKVEFTHTGFAGGAAGLYSAMGEVPILSTGEMPYGDWAFAEPTDVVPPGVQIVASRPAGDGRFDLVNIVLPSGVRAGDRITFLEMCETVASCGYMSLDLGVRSPAESSRTHCWMRHGEMRVRTLTARRVAGTFSGTAVCAGIPGETQVQAGELDVAMLDPDPEG